MRNRGYLDFLRSEGKCAVSCGAGRGERGEWCDPAHGPVNGMRSKGPDNEAIPLCRFHHELQTSLGWSEFEVRYQINRQREAQAWYGAYLIWKEYSGAVSD